MQQRRNARVVKVAALDAVILHPATAVRQTQRPTAAMLTAAV
jgi:hypothetical protein